MVVVKSLMVVARSQVLAKQVFVLRQHLPMPPTHWQQSG